MEQREQKHTAPTISVLMPTYDQGRFIERAIDSLRCQTHSDWELLIIDDGSPDETATVVAPYLQDARIHYQRLSRNGGLGAALNIGLQQARGEFMAYLPSDDLYYAEHLASLVRCLEDNPEAPLCYSGVRHHYNRTAAGQIDGYPLQLVQVMHRKTAARWTERAELVTDDLGRMFWHKVVEPGAFQTQAVGTGMVTCEWVSHPMQRHKIVQEPVGGIHLYRQRYGVDHPLRFHTTTGNLMDETTRYAHYRSRPDTPKAADGLKILLVGELAYNADRVLALEERGHQLFGLWMPEPYWYNSVGPLPFGHVTDLPRDDWQAAIAEVQPDVIYALLNWQAVPFAHSVMKAATNIPFVWHFKEGPFICLEKGSWPQLVELSQECDGLIHSSPEMGEWFDTVIPRLSQQKPCMVLDGDLPKRDWFTAPRSPRLADRLGETHTVVPGRPIGLHPQDVAALAQQGIHLHFYGDFTHGQWKGWIDKTRQMAEGYLHLHANCDQEQWVEEFSQYDAGWLHVFRSENEGELRRANWDDLNYPARIATLAAAGLPLIQRANPDAIVATQTLARQMEIGVFFTNYEELATRLRDEAAMQQVRDNVWRQREQFTFDYHADRLITFFRQVIGEKRLRD